jgi:hypothetical protein
MIGVSVYIVYNSQPADSQRLSVRTGITCSLENAL